MFLKRMLPKTYILNKAILRYKLNKLNYNYHIDKIIYINQKKIFLSGWFVTLDKDIDLKIFINGIEKKLNFEIKRYDVYEVLSDKIENELVGFEAYIQNNIEINNLKISIYKENKEIQNVVNLNKDNLKKLIDTENIFYHIDAIERIDKNIVIKGWAFSKYNKNLFIKIDGKKDFIVKKHERLDVNTIYKDIANIKKCGFEVICKNTKSVNGTFIKFIDDYNDINVKLRNNMIIKNYSNSKILFILRNFNINNLKKSIDYLNKYGYKSFIDKINNKHINNEVNYKKWLNKNMPSKAELNTQRNYKFDYEPLISVVVPTFNTPEKFLKVMIDSVINQTYSNWELCIADGASNDDTISILKKYEKQCSKIKVKYLEKNEGISGNSNEALSLASGDYIGLFDHDDILTEDALFEIVKAINENNNPDFIYTDEDKVDEKGLHYFDPHFKPDWSPDLLRSCNYITHFSVFKKELLDLVGGFRSEFDGSQDYDLILRLTEVSKNIIHIPKILYRWRVHQNSVASGAGAKPYAYEAARKALNSHLERINIKGNAEFSEFLGIYKLNYDIISNPLVSIIILASSNKYNMNRCIDSIIKKSTYKNYEIIIVKNNYIDKDLSNYYKNMERNKNIKIIDYDGKFNYPLMNNFGVENSNGEYIILLDSNTEVISENWIEEMLMIQQREDVGIVGGKLYYPDNTIKHSGIILGLNGIAGYAHKNLLKNQPGYFLRTKMVQNVSAIDSICLMVKRSIYEKVNGLDKKFGITFNDIDFCMKVRKDGYLVVFTPYAEIYNHKEKRTISKYNDNKRHQFNEEVIKFKEKWSDFKYDPYYNVNLTLDKEDFSIKIV